jgi:hypothetical protein
LDRGVVGGVQYSDGDVQTVGGFGGHSVFLFIAKVG